MEVPKKISNRQAVAMISAGPMTPRKVFGIIKHLGNAIKSRKKGEQVQIPHEISWHLEEMKWGFYELQDQIDVLDKYTTYNAETKSHPKELPLKAARDIVSLAKAVFQLQVSDYDECVKDYERTKEVSV